MISSREIFFFTSSSFNNVSTAFSKSSIFSLPGELFLISFKTLTSSDIVLSKTFSLKEMFILKYTIIFYYKYYLANNNPPFPDINLIIL